jgi:hypothetical protein
VGVLKRTTGTGRAICLAREPDMLTVNINRFSPGLRLKVLSRLLLSRLLRGPQIRMVSQPFSLKCFWRRPLSNGNATICRKWRRSHPHPAQTIKDGNQVVCMSV